MGTTQAAEKPLVDSLCTQIIIAKADSNFASVEPKIKLLLKDIRNALKNEIQRKNIISEFKSGMKGIPSLIYCFMWRGSLNEDTKNEVQIESLKTIYKLVKTDNSFIQMLFDQDIVSDVNKLALGNEQFSKHISVKVLSFLTNFPEYSKELISYNPLYTLNATVASISSAIAKKTKLLALQGIKSLATEHKSKFVINGITSTLLNILNEKSSNEEIILSMECISKSADDDGVSKNLLEEHFVDIVDGYLSYPEIKVCASAASSVQAICKSEKGRDSITLNSVKSLHTLSTNSVPDARLIANSALLSLCLNESKLEYLKRKGWIKEIVNTFYETQNHKSRTRVIDIINQLSCECLKYTLSDLYEAMTSPLMILILDDDEKISSLALSALVNLSARIELQEGYLKIGAINTLIKLFPKLKSLKDKLNCLIIISLLSIGNSDILYESQYVNFFLARVDRTAYTDYIKDIGTSELEIIEEMVKLAKVTCIGFSVEEVQSKMKEKIKFVYAQCRSPSLHIRCRAAGTIAALASRHSMRKLLYKTGFFNEILTLLRDPKDQVKIAACFALNKILICPDKIELWLKFDSGFVVDASGLHFPTRVVVNKRLNKAVGLYSDWGKEIIKSEIIEIQDMPLLTEWTITVWFLAPMIKHEKKSARKGKGGTKNEPTSETENKTEENDKILVQGRSGTGAIIAANSDYFYTIEQKNGTEVILWSGIQGLKKGWHHLAVALEEDGTIQAYVDSNSNRTSAKVQLRDPLKYFGTSKKGKCPFGILSDLRVYQRCLVLSEIKEIASYQENIIDGLPDKYNEYANTADLPAILIEMCKNSKDVVKLASLESLSILGTKSSCRSNMLRNSIIFVLVDSIRSVNHHIQKHAAKCLVNLG